MVVEVDEETTVLGGGQREGSINKARQKNYDGEKGGVKRKSRG